MAVERRIAQKSFLTVAVVAVIAEGDLGIDDQVPAAGKIYQDIKPGALAILLFEALLQKVFMSFPQTGGFENAFQNEFSPVALDLGGPRRAVTRLAASWERRSLRDFRLSICDRSSTRPVRPSLWTSSTLA